MDCTKCTLKGCRKSSPCSDRSNDYVERYSSQENQHYTKTASSLIDNGRAGTLTRIEEIIEYSKLSGYKHIGVAYCYGLEKEAVVLRKYLEKENFKLAMVSCTVDGLKESQIDPDKINDTVSCNPLGQANVLNSAGVELTILMGLCLGHDIILQKNLTMDFSTFIVKDRVTNHNPLLGLPDYKASEDLFIESIPGNFNLVRVDEFKSKLQTQKIPDNFYLLDLRNSEAFIKDGLPDSINCLLKDLPKQYSKLLPNKKAEVIIYCNGGIQSIYGVMFLYQKGYTNVRSIAGGYSKFLQS